MKDKKLKIPKSVLSLRMTPKKFAKKHNIRLKGKNVSKKEKKHNTKRLIREYSEFAASGLNKAVKIVAEHPKHKKTQKVMDGIDNIISNPDVMKKIVKLYKKDPDSYPNMIYLPHMIMNTLVYYNSDNITEEEKEIAKQLDTDGLVNFCEKILKKEIKRYKKNGLEPTVAYQMATVIPTAKLLRHSSVWYNKLIQQMYDIAESEIVDVDIIIKAILRLDKKKPIHKKEFLEAFFSEFIMQKSSNKFAKMNDRQKELHDGLIERTLFYLDNVKHSKLREILKRYIHRRKDAESHKNDAKRVIKFTDHAHSNSPYQNIKTVVQELITDDPTLEPYLS